jgi:hypothetical protein
MMVVCVAQKNTMELEAGCLSFLFRAKRIEPGAFFLELRAILIHP